MKESTQTLIFLAAALGSVLIATQSQPTDNAFEPSELIGKPLFGAFETEKAKAMRIVRFNEETATLREFEVAEQDGVWSIPSKGGYPADAEDQMAEASTGVTDLEILSIATQSAEDHSEYGVVEPSSELEVGVTGVGTRVSLTDDAGEALVDVVIGKEVKGAEDQHYVRRTQQDVVFTVAIDPENFSTTFEDWIESDLLDLQPWDIARVQVRDFSAELVMQGFRPAIAFDPRGDYTVDFDDDENEWVVKTLREYDKDSEEYVDFELSEEQQLNEETLSELKNAVGDLEIVDVERKPTGLSADLKAGDDFFGDRSAVMSLMDRGFAPTKGQEGETEVLSSEGEVLVSTKDGVEYVLRFGKLQLSEDGEGPADDAATGDDSIDDEESSGVNRYLFVMARVNEEMIEQPELEVVPDAEVASDEEADEDAEEEATESPEEVEKRNQRAQEEYEGKIADAKRRVEELNDRFGDWYYVISDEVYKEIAIGRDQLIEAVESEEDDSEAAEPAAPNPLSGLPNIPGVEFNPTAESGEDAPAEEPMEEAEAPAEEPAEPAEPVEAATEAATEPASE